RKGALNMRRGWLLAVLVGPAYLLGQAWVLPKGQGIVTLAYQNIYVHNHVDTSGVPVDVGHIFSDAVGLDLDYSLTDKLAARVSLPYAAGKYVGDYPHPSWVDNGNFHSTFQDFGIDVRYNIWQRPLLITPFFHAVIPSHGYEYFAHAAAGTDRHEYHAGVNLARRLNPFLPKAYAQARYSYAFVEEDVGVKPNRSNFEYQVGYFLKPR